MDQKSFFSLLASDPDNFEELESCPWCGSTKYQPWGEQSYPGFLSVECGDCHVVYVRRRFNSLGRKRLCDGYLTVRQDPKRAEARALAHDLELNFIYRHIPQGKVLDVGCGGGYLLERMPANLWERWGTELGSDAVQRAKEAINPDTIFEGELESLSLPEGYFDLVIARGVIEHVPFPRQFLNKMAQHVKPSGYIFMSGPNLKGFCAQFYKDRWRLHYPEAHLFHFSVDHLTDALNERGFQLLSDAYHYLETPYAKPEEDILHIARDIQARREGRENDISKDSPPFYGNRYTAIWKR